MVQQLSGSNWDDLGSAYVSAVENFEKAARSVPSERHAVPAETPVADSTVAATTGLFLLLSFLIILFFHYLMILFVFLLSVISSFSLVRSYIKIFYRSCITSSNP